LSKCYSAYKAIIAPTTFLLQAYKYNGLEVPAHLIHFGVDLPREAKPVRAHEHPLRFGFIGQIAHHKGTDLLIDAFGMLRKGEAELSIWGAEEQDPAYSKELRRAAKDSSVFFKGTFPKEKMIDVLNSIDFLVIPSRWYENSPLVLLNALASHTPVIISDVEGMTEFVENGRNGFTFKRDNKEDLHRVLNHIISTPGLAETMSNKTEYLKDSKQMTKEILDIYSNVLES